jgi:tetratricopeptide (TPR) repeat protein
LSEAQLAAGNVSAAERSAWKILDRNKQDAAGWVLLARGAYARGHYKKTLNLCKKALKYEPHYSPAYFWRGRAFEARGEADEASNEYHAATLCNH